MGKMKALVKKKPEAPVALEEVDYQEPTGKDVLIKVKATALCGTDLHIAEWNEWAQNAGVPFPKILGHEFAGKVAAVGEEVRVIEEGDYVAGETHIPCGTCFHCQNDLQHICHNLDLYGVHTKSGSFAEYTTLPEICVRKIPEAIPAKIGAILEPLGTSLRSALDLQVSGDIIVVTGCGPIGLLAISSAKALGAAQVIGVDVLDKRLELAEEVGADWTLNPAKTDVKDKLLSFTDFLGVDAIIEASGSERAVEQCFKYLRKGGKVALIGLPSKKVELNLGPEVVFKEAEIIGIHGRRMFSSWTKMENMLASNLLNIEPIITHEFSLEDFREGFDIIETGKGGKIILYP